MKLPMRVQLPSPKLLIRPLVQDLHAYVPGEQPKIKGLIKLNTNENPYPPSPKVRAALRKAIDESLRLYPESRSDTLRTIAGSIYGVKPANIVAGNGSDELLSMLLRCFVGPHDRVAFPVPTYSLYDTLVAIQDGLPAPVDFPPDFSLPSALAEQSAALTFLCNPNAPSGTLVSLQQIEKLARSLPGVLVIDEAYVDFAGSEGVSSIPLIQRLPNLVVLRTFSKSFSLAGMRIGLAFASEHIIFGMMKVKDSYNVNRLSLIAATAALPGRWVRTDEWYNFRTDSTPHVHVLLTVDEATYTGGTMGAGHPIAWCHDFDGGRAWYTAMGHSSSAYSEPMFLSHLLRGILYASKLESTGCPPPQV